MLEELDPGLAKLEKQHAAKTTSEVEVEFEDVPDTDVDLLERASLLIRNTSILLEFLSNPDFCKTISKRERTAINNHLAKLYTMEQELDEAVAEASDDEEDA